MIHQLKITKNNYHYYQTSTLVNKKIQKNEKKIKHAISYNLFPFPGINDSYEKKDYTLESLKKRRIESPISATAIKKQAQLYKSLREGKVWAAEQETITPLGTSSSNVFKIKSLNGSNDTIAYYKETPRKRDKSGIMEQLMWDTALIMTLEEHFVATSSTTLKIKKHFVKIGKKEKTWNTTCTELVDKITSKATRRGSFQPTQEGITLLEYQSQIKTNPGLQRISNSQFTKGVLVSCLMGFFDAHRNNIIIDPQGNIVFFDNTSSMPHSNGCILWGRQDLRSAFRSGLLNLSETQIPLSGDDRQQITIEIEKYKSKYPALKAFYEHPATQAKISKLPNGWFNPKHSLAAMKERIEQLEKAIADPRITTLCELALASQPNLRFNVGVTFLYHKIKDIPLNSSENEYNLILHAIPNYHYLDFMDMVGYTPIDKCITLCCQHGFDPLSIKNLCNNIDLPFNDMMKVLCSETVRIPPETALKHGTELIDQLRHGAKFDFKDT